MPPYRFPYTRISNPLASTNMAKFKFHPLIKVGLLRNSNLIRIGMAYIDLY